MATIPCGAPRSSSNPPHAPFLHSSHIYQVQAFNFLLPLLSLPEQQLQLFQMPPLMSKNSCSRLMGIFSQLRLSVKIRSSLTMILLLKVCGNLERIRVLVPPKATPSCLVESLGVGRGRRVLCPVPLVVGLDEPPVVPNFLRDLEATGWVPVRVAAYETRWAGRLCAEEIVRRSQKGELDVLVFTSSAEVEGLLRSLKEFGLDFGMLRRRCPELVVAAHRPVTRAGAERLGVKVDVVSSKFDSFDGVVDALSLRKLSPSCFRSSAIF
ncbi:Uroporphyrinogen-III synthase [Quillaja saponaria]|uniref:Uroporphyrinogen-III synthase n=1 Tax=Quillaja saponaria TaxID=32244 RepID=A0AAD7LCH7_QUISA|nr:Uroporphyrinogen-III synthase [Quillaja saponaria]